MPTYDYICKKCGERFEHFQTMSSSPLKVHPGCEENGSEVERIISGGTGLIFKGSGFYLTDYKNKKKKENVEKSQKSKETKKKSSNKKSE
tara:strand:- start:2153 stop:2422 length:270 start_codon:yes stop_codon:yes gene_type:complete